MTLVGDIELHVDKEPGRPYVVIGHVKARVTSGAWAWARRERTIEDVNARLRELAIAKGADAVLDVRYDRGMSLSSWKALTATGIAVRWV